MANEHIEIEQDIERPETEANTEEGEPVASRRTLFRSLKKKYLSRRNLIILAIIIVGILGGCIGVATGKEDSKEGKKQIISVATLKEIIDVSELSTFEAIYNGVCQVMDEKSGEKVKYHVAYNATVKMGINLEEVNIEIQEEQKKVIVTLPEVKQTGVNVDIGSLDYIFIDKKAETSTVVEEAYRACIEDVTHESEAEEAIYKIARQNAENVIKALISPFIEQVDTAYILEIR